MNLRSLTGFASFTDPLDESPLRAFARLAHAGRDEFAHAGLPLQTTRVATQSINAIQPGRLTQFARDLQAAAKANDILYTALGAANCEDEIALEIPSAINSTETVFASLHLTRDHSISFRAIKAAARVMHDLGHATPNGFGNLRFAALANVSAHSPFFPAAYHDGAQPAFSIATEAAPLAVETFSHAKNLDDARANLVNAIEYACLKISAIAEKLAKEFSFRFAGIDFSMAPYPKDSHSIGAAIEKLMDAKFGEHGTLFASAFITDCIKQVNFPRVGFSGIFLPVLEDSVLGARPLTTHQLLLYSAVCGTGLDTIPLPGDTAQDVLAAILLDLATLALKLCKPLTARLMPMPGLKAGDATNFDFEYFAPAHVMNPSGVLSRRMMDNNNWIALGGKDDFAR